MFCWIFKKLQITYYDLLRFVSHVLWRAWRRTWWCALYRTVDIMISVTNQMEAAEAMFVAEVFRTKMKNFKSFTGQWRLLSAWRAMLELHLSLRTGSLRSWNDLRISLRETGTAVHMIFRQNFVVPGHWFSPKKVVILWVRALTVRETAFGCCCYCCWQPHGLLICN